MAEQILKQNNDCIKICYQTKEGSKAVYLPVTKDLLDELNSSINLKLSLSDQDDDTFYCTVNGEYRNLISMLESDEIKEINESKLYLMK